SGSGAAARRVSLPGVRDDRCETRANVSADDGGERLAELLRLGRVQLDHAAAAALQRDAHDDAASLLRDLERPVTRPRLHRGHVELLRVAGADLGATARGRVATSALVGCPTTILVDRDTSHLRPHLLSPG